MSSSDDHDFSVLIPDGESYLLKSVVNGLAQVPGIKIFAMSNKKENAMRYSRLLHKFSYYPKTDNELDWIANINKEVEENDIDVIMPIWETAVKSLVIHRSKIAQPDKLCLLPKSSDLDTAINKWNLSEHLNLHNIPYPRGVMVESLEQLGKTDDLNAPIIIKPVEGWGGGSGIRMFYQKQDLDSYFLDQPAYFPYVIQEYIEGYDIDCSVLCKDGNILTYTIQKGNLANEKEFGPPIGLDFLYEDKLYVVVERLMKSLNWSGVAHIDLRYDKNDTQFKVIEVNARYWGSLDASLLAGVNFPYLHCHASLNKPVEQTSYRHITYLSVDGLKKKIMKNLLYLFRLDFIFNNTPLKFALKDPLPMLYRFFRNVHD